MAEGGAGVGKVGKGEGVKIFEYNFHRFLCVSFYQSSSIPIGQNCTFIVHSSFGNFLSSANRFSRRKHRGIQSNLIFDDLRQEVIKTIVKSFCSFLFKLVLVFLKGFRFSRELYFLSNEQMTLKMK